jgi:PhnB protein
MILAQLSVRRSREALAFYQEAFGATVDYLVGADDIVAQLSAYGGTFWIAEEAPDYQNFSPESADGKSTIRLMLLTDDPEAAHERAVNAGATQVHPVEEAYGWRIGRIADPYGHHWEIAKPPTPWPPTS